jgi:Xaa-Pro aminopeptidase
MHEARLNALRAELRRYNLDGFLIPRADEHLGEYVAPAFERLAWLTGFTGSAGLAVVLAGAAAVFSDGRYQEQLAVEVDGALWERRHSLEDPPARWLASHAKASDRIGYDPMLMSEEDLRPFREAGLTLQPVAANPVDRLWADRPPPPAAPAEPHPLCYSGVASAEKRATLAAALAAAGQDAAVLTDPASIAWLLNLRGGDVPHTPVALGFALLRADASVELVMSGEKLGPATRAWLGADVRLHERAELAALLAGLAGKRVRVDAATAPVWFAETLRAAGATVVTGADPCLLPKACKNAVEQEGARRAHLRCGVALCRFLAWLARADRGVVSERTAAARLLALRAEAPEFRGESFAAISAAGPHAALPHYHATAASDRELGADELYLIDSGGQYVDGTTDVTRTVWTGPGLPPAELRDRYSRVLEGHAALARQIFPQGVGGVQLDVLARAALWERRLDFDHGTGHGVGSYLSVHEGPARIARTGGQTPLAAGMILSDEPGYYLPGRYGIRLENLLLVTPAGEGAAGRPFLGFEVLTLAPFDRRLIDQGLLSVAARRWLDAYHARVEESIGPLLAAPERAWLAAACAPLA